jgi:hypothetical protein
MGGSGLDQSRRQARVDRGEELAGRKSPLGKLLTLVSPVRAAIAARVRLEAAPTRCGRDTVSVLVLLVT